MLHTEFLVLKEKDKCQDRIHSSKDISFQDMDTNRNFEIYQSPGLLKSKEDHIYQYKIHSSKDIEAQNIHTNKIFCRLAFQILMGSRTSDYRSHSNRDIEFPSIHTNKISYLQSLASVVQDMYPNRIHSNKETESLHKKTRRNFGLYKLLWSMGRGKHPDKMNSNTDIDLFGIDICIAKMYW